MEKQAAAALDLPLYLDEKHEEEIAPAPLPQPATSKRRSLLWKLILGGVVLYYTGGLLHSKPHPCHHAHEHKPHAESQNPAVLVKARHGAVASENWRCSNIGVDVLKEGGNAVDAAIATSLCIDVVNPFASGIMGGGFMTVRIPPKEDGEESEVWTLNYREIAPAASNISMFEKNPIAAQRGGLASAVPGEVLGLETAHQMWGKLPWKRLVEPAVNLAAGWEVDRELGRRLPWFSELLLNEPEWGAIFAPNGTILGVGDPIKNAALSETLSLIAEGGSEAFYSGPVAESIVRRIQETGGILTLEDLTNYFVEVAPPVVGTYRGKKVYTFDAPTSGPVLLHALNLMEHYPMEERTPLNVHRMVEAMKFAFAARTRISDPNFSDESQDIAELSTKAFAEKIFPNMTDDTTHPPEYYHPIFDMPIDHGTSHCSIVDEDGMAVALTHTINGLFGSFVIDPETGIIMNNEMDDFAVPGHPNLFGLWPSPYNYPEPGKRPLSSTAPTIVEHEDGSFYVAIGGAGGSRIFPSIYQVLLNLEWGMDVSSAIEYGRVHDQLYPLVLDVDDSYDADVIEGLKARGHNVTVTSINDVKAVVQAVVLRDGEITAASDSRKNGIAAGY
ncbi:nucleophile aminohydrolase [Schizophyllum amplum]|uniref:Glutathione hydrolase n=1 Tax=Schizophyllum amplum TaxID=97359 RepID=A0A550CYA2_9AGAR|nr:nucleophile aminohydrolase [Auriculariopsis ampla]